MKSLFPKMSVFGWLCLLCLACSAIFQNVAFGQDRINFDRDVRPLLSDRCFFCHGPDASKREADLRLDVREVALAAGAIVPGDVENSEILNRISSHDPDLQMPPPSAKLGRLSEQEADTLRKWILQGAEYQAHWSFIPLDPDSGTEADAAKRVDQLVRSSLAEKGLQMQPQADRRTLIRRLSFDLTGLPPEVAEIEAYVNDSSPDATDRVISRLLSSPHFGERMAVDWLDTARYADSFGFQVDREREMWPWRDWVVRALNENLPFDQFITWQLAGDLLPEPTQDQILATAFNRLHQQESEGGSVEEEYRVEYVCDRVQTFATAFLGLTFECARCHDHKYDPISQKEYYQLFAMFQNIDEAGLYSFFTTSPPTPTLTMMSQDARSRLQELQSVVDGLEARSNQLIEDRNDAFTKWLNSSDDRSPSGATARTSVDLSVSLPELGRYSFDSMEGDKLANSVAPDKPAVLRGDNLLVPGKSGMAIRFTGDDPVDLPFGNFRREEPFSVSLWLKTPDFKERAVVFHRSRAWTDAASRGYELLIEDGKLKWSLIHFWPGNAASVMTSAPLTENEWTHIVVSSDGSSRAGGLRIYVNGQLAETIVVRDHLTREITGGGGDNIALAERFRDRGLTGGMIDEFRVFSRELTPLEALSTYDPAAAAGMLQKPVQDLKPQERDTLRHYYLAVFDSSWQDHTAALQAARREAFRYFEGLREIMAMRELPQPKKAYVLFRGEYSQRRDEVFAGTPAALSPFPEAEPRNRLGLARWLTDPSHPLTARVTVNRVWQSLFGHGLVRTSEDFGSQGARPMYPEVLDTLALEFIRSGWDLKHLIRTIVRTDVYRQRSFADGELMTQDPDNELLARGPRFRLSAEMIRDNALAVAGLLNARIGGPPVNPYEMEEAFKPVKVSSGEDAYRRSLYTNWRRTGPPPAMLAFDAPRRAVCIARRERTDSPLQALILLNGVQYVEAARVLGERLYVEHQGNVPDMIVEGCLKCLSRRPDGRESEILAALHQEQLEYYQQHTEEAAALLKIGQAPHNEQADVADLAAATMLAQALLNHDECVVRR